jgi:hypothetical protein
MELKDFDYNKIICEWNKREIGKSIRGYVCDCIEDIKLRIAINSEPDWICDARFSRLTPRPTYYIHGQNAEGENIFGKYAYVLEE